jgi:nucleotide sugar dehydrogenase
VSTPIILAKPEDLNTPEKRAKYTVCILGCGRVGVVHAVLLAEAGFRVICFDSDLTLVNRIAKGKARFLAGQTESRLRDRVKARRITTSNDLKQAMVESGIIVVAVPVKIDSKGKVDHSNLGDFCKRIGANLQVGSIVVLVRPVGMGIMDGLVKEALEGGSGFKVGKDIGLAYSPFVPFAAERMVAASDQNSLNVAAAVLASISGGQLKKIENVRAAETAAMFLFQQRDVSGALSRELASFCEKAGVDYLEVGDVLKGSAVSSSSASVLTESDENEEPYLLLADAENLNVRLRVSSAAREVNEQAARQVVNLVKDALARCGKTMRRARVCVLGLCQTTDAKGPPKEIAGEIAELLVARGARIHFYDPYYCEDDLVETQFRLKKTFAEAVENCDCVVILTGHDQSRRLNLRRLRVLMKKNSAVVDLVGVVEPDKVEKEGFVYRGLGRGVWTK